MMPSVKAVGSTLLLTKKGWSPIKQISSATRAVALGVDRHGSIERRDVSITHARDLTCTGFLGTPASFGEFSPATRILTNSGMAFEVGRLIEEVSMPDTCFETYTDIPEDCTWDHASELIWEVLRTAAALDNGDRIALKCRNARSTGRIKTRSFGTHEYSLFERNELQTDLEKNPIETVLEIGKAWLRNQEEARLELERACHTFAAFYVGGVRKQKCGYRLAFDTLQHTAYVYIVDADEAPLPLARGACAFYGTTRGQEFTISWNGGSWNPIASGFVLSAD